jgi:hypothetical protein
MHVVPQIEPQRNTCRRKFVEDAGMLWWRYCQALSAKPLNQGTAENAWFTWLESFIPDESARRAIPLPRLLVDAGLCE